MKPGGLEPLFRLVGLPATPRMFGRWRTIERRRTQTVLIARRWACRLEAGDRRQPFTALDAPRVVELSFSLPN